MEDTLKRYFTLIFLALSLFSCAQEQENSNPKHVAFKGDSKHNVAVLIGAAMRGRPEFLSGVLEDLQGLSSLFKNELGIRPVLRYDPSAKEALEATYWAAKEVGRDGTLIWYFSGHGGRDGSLYTRDPYGGDPEWWLDAKTVADTIARARTDLSTNKNDKSLLRIKRVIFLFDNCYSGRAFKRFDIEDIVRGDPWGRRKENYDPIESTFFDQILVASASRSFETALDSQRGGLFTRALRSSFLALQYDSSATIGDLAKKVTVTTKALARKQYSEQEPEFADYPRGKVMRDKLWE